MLQIGVFVIGYELTHAGSSLAGQELSHGAGTQFSASVFVFAFVSSLQWLITSFLKGDFRISLAVLNLLLLGFIIFHPYRLTNSLLILFWALFSITIGQIFYHKLFSPPLAEEDSSYSDILDEDV